MLLARWLNSVEWVLDDWPRIDLRAFGPGLLRGVVPILERCGEQGDAMGNSAPTA